MPLTVIVAKVEQECAWRVCKALMDEGIEFEEIKVQPYHPDQPLTRKQEDFICELLEELGVAQDGARMNKFQGWVSTQFPGVDCWRNLTIEQASEVINFLLARREAAHAPST